MLATKFLAEVMRELLGARSEDLRGKRIVFESKLPDKKRVDEPEKEITYYGQIAGFAHRRVSTSRPRVGEAELVELMLYDSQARLSRSSRNTAWVLTLSGDKYLGNVKLE